MAKSSFVMLFSALPAVVWASPCVCAHDKSGDLPALLQCVKCFLLLLVVPGPRSMETHILSEVVNVDRPSGRLSLFSLSLLTCSILLLITSQIVAGRVP